MTQLELALKNGVDIAYGPLVQIPLPPDSRVVRWLTPEIALLGGTRMKNIDKAGVFSLKAGLLADVSCKKAELTKSGLILTAGKKNVSLMTPEGRELAGDECDDVKDLGEGYYAKKKKKFWAVFRTADGAQLTGFDYLDVSEYSEGTCAAQQKAGTYLLGPDGKPVFPTAFGYASAFRNGFAIVGDRKTRSYIDRTGRTVFAGAGPRSRHFLNGYAVFEDAKGKFGAIDTAGQVVLAPQYRFVKDAMSHMFVVSDSGSYQPDGTTFSGKDYGLIAAGGRQILPPKYGRIDPRPDGGYNYGHPVLWTLPSGNQRITYMVLVFGIVDAAGRIVLPDRYVAVGEASEGLRAFKTYEDNVLRFGYMREDATVAFEVASVNYTLAGDPERTLLREDISLQLLPFADGEAVVTVRNAEQRTGVFKNKTEIAAVKSTPYRIDRQGREVRPEGAAQQTAAADLLTSPELTFTDDIAVMTGSKFLAYPLKDALFQIIPFGDMVELNFTFGFALFDRSGHIFCQNRDGMPPGMTAPQFIYAPSGTHEKYASVRRAADNVWLVTGGQGTSVVFSAFESPQRFADGLAVFRKLESGSKYLYGVMDSAGQVIVAPRYTEAAVCPNGCIYVKDGDQSALLRREKTVTVRQSPAV